jgi:alpha-galactosidase
MRGRACLALLAMVVLAAPTAALDNGVGQRPAMAWNSWNTFRCDVNESLVMETADAMVSSGLRDAGYLYVNLGACATPGPAPRPSPAACAR